MKITTAIITSILTSLSVTGTDSDGDGLSDAFEHGEGRYKIIKKKLTWSQADLEARSLGGYLATITSAQEEQNMKRVLGRKVLPNSHWLGGTDKGTEGDWRWITGEDWQYTKWWRKGEPNNMWDSQNVLQTFKGGWDDTWNNIPAEKDKDQNVGYILELFYPTDPNNPDTDGDGINDGDEYHAGTNPLDPDDHPRAPSPVVDIPTGPGDPPELRCRKVIAELEDRNRQLEDVAYDYQDQIAALKQQVQTLQQQQAQIETQVSVVTGQLEHAIVAAETPFINGWVYDSERGWIYTDADCYPLVYVNDDQSWYYYELGSAAPRWFYSMNDQQWVAWDQELVN